jgi:hypothetical protein
MDKFPIRKDEGNFNQCLHRVLDHIDIEKDILLFGVDDLVYFREFNIQILEELNNHPDALGYTLRLGTNIFPYQTFWNTSRDKRLIKYDWRDKPSHYGYPFEVSNSAYRASLFKEILDVGGDKIQIPNDLESIGVQYCLKNKRNQPYTLMTNGLSYSACLDINRVQSKYENRTQGTEEETSEKLLELYNQGYRMDWTQYHHLTPTDCFIGKFGMKLCKDDKSSSL